MSPTIITAIGMILFGISQDIPNLWIAVPLGILGSAIVFSQIKD